MTDTVTVPIATITRLEQERQEAIAALGQIRQKIRKLKEEVNQIQKLRADGARLNKKIQALETVLTDKTIALEHWKTRCIQLTNSITNDDGEPLDASQKFILLFGNGILEEGKISFQEEIGGPQ